MTPLFKLELTIADEPRQKKEAVRDMKSRPIVHDTSVAGWRAADMSLRT